MPKSNALLVPTNVKPVKYQITLEPNMEAFTFKGQESIDIEILEPTDSITLNSVEIEVQSAQVSLGNGDSLNSQNITYDEEQEPALLQWLPDNVVAIVLCPFWQVHKLSLF